MAICNICGKPVFSGVVVHRDCLPGWISSEERLPEEVYQQVLVLGKNLFGAWVPDVAYQKDNEWHKNSKKLDMRVFYWMPLPNPPEVE